jgi:hypothetical protein
MLISLKEGILEISNSLVFTRDNIGIEIRGFDEEPMVVKRLDISNNIVIGLPKSRYKILRFLKMLPKMWKFLV